MDCGTGGFNIDEVKGIFKMDVDDSSEINTSSGDIKVEAEVGNLNLVAGNAGESSIKLNTLMPQVVLTWIVVQVVLL